MKRNVMNRLVLSTILFVLSVANSMHATASEVNPHESNLNAIVLDGSIDLTWVNDSVYAWTLEDGYLKSGNYGHKYSASEISFKYSSLHTTNISFKYQNNASNSSHKVDVYVDGVKQYGDSYYAQDIAFRLPKGNHIITIRDTITNGTDVGWYSKLWDVKVTESPAAIEDSISTSSCVLDGCIDLTWDNSGLFGWTLENGYLKSGNYGHKYSASEISFKYSSLHTTNISFKYQNNASNSSHKVDVYVDGEKKYGDSYYAQDIAFRLPKGNHIITIRDTITSGTDVGWYSKLWDVKVTESPAAIEDSINTSSCVLDGCIDLTWDNSGLFGWTLEDGYLKSGNFGHKYSASEISFKYSSLHTTNISFKYQNNASNSSHKVDVYVDGEKKYGDSYYAQDIAFRLPKGNHIITIRDTIQNSTDVGWYSKLWDVKVTEYASPESVILTQRSMPISFEDVGKQPWFTENGCIRSNNASEANSNSIMRSTVVVDKPTKFSFKVKTENYQSDHHTFSFSINNNLYYKSGDSDWKYFTTILQPGSYELEWKDENKYSGDSYYYSLVKEVELHQNWVGVNITPGMLGIETLYKVNVLTDVELFKVVGTLNDTDWETIKMMTNLHHLDLSETTITAIPEKAFSGFKYLSTVDLPDGLKKINKEAFINSYLRYIHIPASVTYIGESAFKSTPLHNITFSDNSMLQSIGYQAFYNCTWLEEFIMPNSVTKLETQGNNSDYGYTFYNCWRMKKIVFSDNLRALPAYTCNYCTSVKELHLPTNAASIGSNFMNGANSLKELTFPATLKSIGDYAFSELDQVEQLELPEKLSSVGYYAFSNADRLKEVILPSGVDSYNRVFEGCYNIHTITCRAATPPHIVNDPFSSTTKSNVTLKVPNFAIATYKLDSYWYKFGNIVEGEPTDYWRIIGDLRLLNNRRMEGKPDIDLYYGGKLTVGGDAPMTIGKFDIYNSESNPSSFVSESQTVTADEINTIYYVEANKWYFITPMIDIDLQQVNVSGASNYVFRYYDGATRAEIGAGTSWKNVSDMKLKAGVGYIFQCNAASNVTFPVPVEMHSKILTTESVTLPLTAYPSDNKANKGWNYVGNPYPSYYDIYYMDFTSPITVWDGNTYRAYSIADDNYVLRPMQGFFVQKPDAVDAIVLQSEGRQIEKGVNRASAPSVTRNQSSRLLFNLQIGCDTIADMTRIVLNDNASLGYEIECDAAKFMSMNSDVPQIYTIDNANNKLAINERPKIDEPISLGVYLPLTEQMYTITASAFDGIAKLYDSADNVCHNFSDGDYQFIAKTAGVDDSRFTIRLLPSASTAIYDKKAHDIKVEASSEDICILNAKGLEYEIVGVDGITHIQATAKSENESIPSQKGIYIVLIGENSYKIVVK